MNDFEQVTGDELGFMYPTWLKDKETCTHCQKRIVKGKDYNGEIRYLKTELGREIKHCSICDEELHPTANSKRYIRVQNIENLDQQLRAKYSISQGKNVREWMEENHSKKDSNGEYIINNYAELVSEL